MSENSQGRAAHDEEVPFLPLQIGDGTLPVVAGADSEVDVEARAAFEGAFFTTLEDTLRLVAPLPGGFLSVSIRCFGGVH